MPPYEGYRMCDWYMLTNTNGIQGQITKVRTRLNRLMKAAVQVAHPKVQDAWRKQQ